MLSDTLICPTHGEIDLTKAAGCPECVRELRDGAKGQHQQFKRALLADEILSDLIDYWVDDSGPLCPHCHKEKSLKEHYGWCKWEEYLRLCL